jgi:hypothetical protein
MRAIRRLSGALPLSSQRKSLRQLQRIIRINGVVPLKAGAQALGCPSS